MTLSLNDLTHKGIFLDPAVIIYTTNQENLLCGSKTKGEYYRFMKDPGLVKCRYTQAI
jgi:hypothetical protein